MRTSVCDLLGIEVPILQAGMGQSRGSPTTPELVAAVSEAGGLGCLGATGLDPVEIRHEILRIRSLTAKPFAVNLILPASLAEADVPREDVRREIEQRFPDHWRFVAGLMDELGLPLVKMDREFAVSPTLVKQQFQVLLDESVPVFVSGLGDPRDFIPAARESGMKVIGIAGSLRNALRQRDAGVDAVIGQGYEGGGHTGRVATLPLIPQIVDACAPIPVIAAGGIVDGRGLIAALALGAQAVWCGTAFLFAEEANIRPVHREALQSATSDDFVTSKSYTGKPVRTLKNSVMLRWEESGLEPLPMPLQYVLMDDLVASAIEAGRPDLLANPAGQGAGMLTEVRPAATIVHEMATVADATCSRLMDICSNSARPA